MHIPYNNQFEAIIKTPNISHQRRKLSTEYKSRSRYQRQKQKQINQALKYESQDLSKYAQKKGDKMFVIKQFSQTNKMQNNCSSFIQKKKNSLPANKQNNNCDQKDFANIMQNITEFLKKNQKKEKIPKQQKTHVEANFFCMRAKIHHQYNFSKENDSSQELSNETINKLKRQTINEIKNICNPFFATKTVTFNRVELHKLQKPKNCNNSLNIILRSKKSSISRIDKLRSSSIQKRVLVCSDLNGDIDNNYLKKMKNYMQFLFKVNYSNQIYVKLNLQKNEEISTPFGTKYKMFIGRGNNSLLVKTIMKKKFWWQVTKNVNDTNINFYWSQNNLDMVHEVQKTSDPRKSNNSSQVFKRSNRIKSKILKDYESFNQKILPYEKCFQVQNYVLHQGFKIPFQSQFIPDILSNHLPRNNAIGSKKNLFKSLYHYYKQILNKNPFDIIPQTYHVDSRQSSQFNRFIKQNEGQQKKVWIVKPGQNTNRGTSIFLAQFTDVHQLINKAKHKNGKEFTYIIQSYINRPFLYYNRKFDIRHYMLITSVNGAFKAYWYKEGYIRTSSEAFDIQNLGNNYIHLTNDAVQKNGQNFSKFEQSNKLSYSQFQRYLQYIYPSKNYNFEKDILNKMKQITLDVVKANYLVIDNKRNKNNFQIFGLDFMIDRDFKPWLIEVNYNPCLEVNCLVLERIIPSMLENSFRIALDPLFPPHTHFPPNKKFYLSDNYLKKLKYQLIFDSLMLKEDIKNSFVYEDDKLQQDEYEDQGQQLRMMES